MMKKLLAALLALMLFCSCAMAEETVVATIGENTITRMQLDTAYEAAYGDYAQGDADTEFELRLELLNRMLRELCESIMEKKLGFDVIADDEMAELREEAEMEYAGLVNSYMMMLDDSEADEAALRAQAVAWLESMDMSAEDYLAEKIADTAYDKLYAYATDDLELSEEQIELYYEQMVEDDRAAVSVYPDSFISCSMYGVPFLYVPEGVRLVRRILIAFDADQAEQYLFLCDAAENGQDIAEQMDALYAELEPRVQEVQQLLDAGAAFEDVEAQYSDDWLLLGDDVVLSGYYVSEGCEMWDASLVEAAMALTRPGEITGPTRTSEGYYYYYYQQDVTAGPVPLDEVRDYVAENAYYAGEAELYEAKLEGWMEELGCEIYLDELV